MRWGLGVFFAEDNVWQTSICLISCVDDVKFIIRSEFTDAVNDCPVCMSSRHVHHFIYRVMRVWWARFIYSWLWTGASPTLELFYVSIFILMYNLLHILLHCLPVWSNWKLHPPLREVWHFGNWSGIQAVGACDSPPAVVTPGPTKVWGWGSGVCVGFVYGGMGFRCFGVFGFFLTYQHELCIYNVILCLLKNKFFFCVLL